MHPLLMWVELEFIMSCIILGFEVVRSGCLFLSIPNTTFSLRSGTFSRGRSFLLDIFSLICLFHISEMFFNKTRLFLLQKEITNNRLFFKYEVMIIPYNC